MNSKYFRILAWVFIVISTFSSCSQKLIGYGTILWAPEDSLFQTGQTVTIISESELADVYLLNDGISEETIQMERWRVAFFEDEILAKEKSKTILEYKTIFARNLKDGLLIREQPSINSERVYKMRKNQIIKVSARTAEIYAVGQYEGYWYQSVGMAFGLTTSPPEEPPALKWVQWPDTACGYDIWSWGFIDPNYPEGDFKRYKIVIISM